VEPRTLESIAAIMGGALSGAGEQIPSGCSIDSRTLQPGELFFAIVGPHHDGHRFAQAAVAAGACGLVVSNMDSRPDAAGAARRAGIPLITVSDTLRGLQDLAAHIRRAHPVKVIGITGSAGKTTTKEMTRHVLEGAFRVHASRGNLNNLYGCPLSLTELTAQHQACVLELGMSTHGELTRLAEIADPDIGILTNVSGAHLANFTSLSDYADAKAELFAGMRDNTTGIFNNDDDQCRRILSGYRGYAVTCGMDRPSDLTASDYRLDGLEGSTFEVRHARNGSSRRVQVRMRFAGRHHVYNALMAIAAAYMLGMDLEAAAARLADLSPLGMRGRVLKLKGGLRVLDDSYNSNPGAMRFALQLLREAGQTGGRRVLVFGDMLELGSAGMEAHRELGEAIAAAGVDLAVGVGKLAGVALGALEQAPHGGAARHHFESSQEAAEWMAGAARPGDLILVKGSRGIALEKVVAELHRRFGEE